MRWTFTRAQLCCERTWSVHPQRQGSSVRRGNGKCNVEEGLDGKVREIRGRYPNAKDLLDVQEHLKEKYIQKRFYVPYNADAIKEDNMSQGSISFKSCDVKNTSVISTNNNSMLESDKFDSKSASPGTVETNNVLKKPSMFKKCQSSQIVHNENKAFDFSLCESLFASNNNNNVNTNNNNINNNNTSTQCNTPTNLMTHDFTKSKKVMDCVNDIYQSYNSEKKIDPLDKLFYQYNFSTGNHMRMNNNNNNTNNQYYSQQTNMYNNNNNQLDCIYGINKF